MHTFFELLEFIEYVFGLTNAMLGIIMALYIAKSLRSYKADENKKLVDFVKLSLFAVIFLSLFSLSHFIREIFHLKEIYGSIAELPEYIFIFLAFVTLLWQVTFNVPEEI